MSGRSRVVGLLAVAAAFLVPASASAAVGPCSLYAAPNGSDSASGSATAPLKTVQRLADSLTAGQVGCLRAGTYGDSASAGEAFKQLKVSRPGIALTSAPGEVARIDARVWVAKGANGVTLENLYLDGANSRNLPSPTVNAENTVFRHDEVTDDHTGICFSLGAATYGEAKGTVIEESRIHACGAEPSTNQHHGIYVAEAQNTLIRGNWIYDNVNRGIQLYPSAKGTTITGNVIYGNGEGVIFSGDESTASSGSLVAHNVIAGSEIRRNVESYYEAGAPIGTGNVVKENCTYGAPTPYYAGPHNSGVQEPEVGFSAVDNVVAQPIFVDAAAGDFELTAKSGCRATLAPTPDGKTPGLLVESSGDETPTGEPPATEPPATEDPATEPPADEPPAGEDPATEAPGEEAPASGDPSPAGPESNPEAPAKATGEGFVSNPEAATPSPTAPGVTAPVSAAESVLGHRSQRTSRASKRSARHSRSEKRSRHGRHRGAARSSRS